MSLLLDVRDIKKTFFTDNQTTEVLKGVGLKLNKGESLSIVGGSGAGKSTFLQIIGTLDKASSGQIYYEEQNLNQLSELDLAKFRNQNLGFIFQFHYLLNEFTALENVSMPARIAGLSKAESLERASTLLNRLGMSHRESHFPSALSGGEQQRVAIARSLIMKPSLLLADEPTGNLDKKNTNLIKDVFLEVVSDYKVSLVVVTHDQHFASAFERTRLMKDGLWS